MHPHPRAPVRARAPVLVGLARAWEEGETGVVAEALPLLLSRQVLKRILWARKRPRRFGEPRNDLLRRY